MSFQITSPAFKEGEMIPAKYTCDSTNISPALAWDGVPEGTKSFVLINDDPDSSTTWVHWVAYNIPGSARKLPENVPPKPKLSDGTLQGTNDFRNVGYGGPCPPSGTHRYFFKLYALDTVLPTPPKVTKPDLESAMKGHILGQAQLMGRYVRPTR